MGRVDRNRRQHDLLRLRRIRRHLEGRLRQPVRTGFRSSLKERLYTEGEDFVRDNVVATGVYLIDEWTQDERIVLTTDDDHWKFDAKTPRIEMVQAGDPTNLATLLRTGQIDTCLLYTSDAADE